MVTWVAALDRKLLRDLRHLGPQAMAIALVMGAGIAMFVMSLFALQSLTQSRQDYYRAYRFGEIFATAKRVPNSVIPQIQEVPGVSAVSTRIVAAASLDLPDFAEPITARMISLPNYQPPLLNDVYLVEGRALEPGHSNELIASQSFMEAHRLSVGDSLKAVINGKQQVMKIVGVGLSPEYVIQIQPGALLPDYKRFGIFWMSERQMAAAFDMDGAFNDVSVTMEKGVQQQAVIDRLDQILERYGCTGAYGRDRQTSHVFLSDEIKQLKTMAIVAPAIFLAVAAFLMHVVIGRIVGLQREQIAALKAFGYSDLEIAWHYLKLVLAVSLVASILGILLGIAMGRGMTQMYAQVYQFPVYEAGVDWRTAVAGFLISALTSSLAASRAIRSVVRLPPAEAMRPEPPASFRPSLLERLGLGVWLPQIFRMILRQLQRKKMKAATAILGIAMSLAVMIVGSFSLDALRYIMKFQFSLAQRQTLAVSFIEDQNAAAIDELRHQAGVVSLQSFRSVAMELKAGHRSRRVGVMGLGGEIDLYRLLNVEEQPVDVPHDGIVLSDKLAQLLEVDPGDALEAKMLGGRRRSGMLVVSAVVTEFGGLNAYMSPASMAEFTGDQRLYSGAFLDVDNLELATLYRQLKEMPTVAGVTIKGAAVRSFEENFAENILTMRTFNVLFSIIIAVGVVYNNARISLSEQSRDLATMRVMGFSRGEVASILLGELGILTVLAIPVGWLLGYGLAGLFVLGLDTEVYRIPLVIDRSTYWVATLVVLVASLLSGLVVLGRLSRLDLVAVLKTRE